ncbi:FemAB family protein [Candidatus Promineifilum breve]|uniref:FemAB family protein n=1 Tax=Candidatus Promineifilum breve TaxID=1806508 RepID=A0A170PF36_9CHLR|nr:peptidoglycan bridge formation glycyltransferase FemA/FemB family protein [Candidatus Promineifilum breve]CUS02943.2 FemAB family protein [Candidatus Promineifilum breve]
MVSQLPELGEQPYSAADAEWDAFVAAHPHGSLLQTTNWARLKSRFGWSSQRVWLRRDGRLVAGAQVLFRSVALGVVKLGYIPHGPLVDWGDDEQLAVLFNQIDQAAYGRGAGLLKLEPRLWLDEMPADEWQALYRRHGCVPSPDTIQPPRTVVIDLRPAEEEILAAMKQKTRYNIRLAEKKGVTVRLGTAADLSGFNRLMQATGARDQFGIHQPEYYRAAFEIFAPDNAALWLAEYEGRPLAGVMVFAAGESAAYLYGASSDEERQRMPAYAAQWAAMRWAKARGCTSYDLWGVPDAEEEELEAGFAERQDGLWPVYRFKRGFGGEVKRTVGAADRVYNNLLHRLYAWQRKR